MVTSDTDAAEPDLARLRRLRLRIGLDLVAERLVPCAAAGCLLVLALVAVDTATALPAAVLIAGLATGAVTIALGFVRLAIAAARHDWSLVATARFAAARDAGSRNALASWLDTSVARGTPAYVIERLRAAAANEAHGLDARALVPFARHRVRALLLATAAVALGAVPLTGYDLWGRLASHAAADAAAASLAGSTPVADARDRLFVSVTPPTYTGLGPRRLEDPTEIQAPLGSRVEIVLCPGRAGVTARMSLDGGAPVEMTPGDGGLTASFAASADGSIAIEPLSDSGLRPKLILPVTVVPDRPPEVHIREPKGDLLVEPAVRPKSLAVSFEARDDYAIGTAKLVYIRSKGEGDATEFANGSLPVEITSRNGAAVTGRVVLDMDRLGVVAGCALVFHVEATDRNGLAGAATGLSETLVFEVAPERPPASITIDELRPEDLQRFLLSQRMILEHTKALVAKRASLPRDEFLSRSTEIAGEQREFKESFNQFIEIQGTDEHDHDVNAALTSPDAFATAQREGARETATDGEKAHEAAVESETEEHQHGTGDGPSAPSTPARELLLAVRAMWDAEGSLGIGEPEKAIPSEEVAIDHLKRAQRAVRYFPRAKVKIKPIDLKRRYAGDLDEIESAVERLEHRDLSPGEIAARDVLAKVTHAARQASAIDADGDLRSAAASADSLAATASSLGDALLAAETDYKPALVRVAARLAAASANARRLSDAAHGDDTARARSATTALANELVGAATELAAVLAARPVARGGAAPPAPARAGSKRAAEYFRRLAGGAR